MTVFKNYFRRAVYLQANHSNSCVLQSIHRNTNSGQNKQLHKLKQITRGCYAILFKSPCCCVVDTDILAKYRMSKKKPDSFHMQKLPKYLIGIRSIYQESGPLINRKHKSNQTTVTRVKKLLILYVILSAIYLLNLAYSAQEICVICILQCFKTIKLEKTIYSFII